MSKNRKNQKARWVHTPLATGTGTSAFQAMKTAAPAATRYSHLEGRRV